MYNGRLSTLVTTEFGALKESIDVAHRGIVTRGVLVDAPALRGVDTLEPGDGVGIADIEAAEKEHGITIGEGDALLLRTGQYKTILKDGPLPPTSSSGPLPEILPFLHERNVAVLGSDTGNDVQPTGYERFSNPVHQIGIVGLGIWILDNANLELLAEACKRNGRNTFLINILPLRIPNGTGSPCNPIAVF
jgi:kynurenine formamidase